MGRVSFGGKPFGNSRAQPVSSLRGMSLPYFSRTRQLRCWARRETVYHSRLPSPTPLMIILHQAPDAADLCHRNAPHRTRLGAHGSSPPNARFQARCILEAAAWLLTLRSFASSLPCIIHACTAPHEDGVELWSWLTECVVHPGPWSTPRRLVTR